MRATACSDGAGIGAHAGRAAALPQPPAADPATRNGNCGWPPPRGAAGAAHALEQRASPAFRKRCRCQAAGVSRVAGAAADRVRNATSKPPADEAQRAQLADIQANWALPALARRRRRRPSPPAATEQAEAWEAALRDAPGRAGMAPAGSSACAKGRRGCNWRWLRPERDRGDRIGGRQCLPRRRRTSPCRQTGISLTRYLIEEQRADRIGPDLRLLIEVVARAPCKSISVAVGRRAFGSVLGDAGTGNVQGRRRRRSRRAQQRILLEANACGTSPDSRGEMEHSCRFPTCTSRPVRSATAGSNIDERVGGHHLLGAALPRGVTSPDDAHFLQLTAAATAHHLRAERTVLCFSVGTARFSPSTANSAASLPTQRGADPSRRRIRDQRPTSGRKRRCSRYSRRPARRQAGPRGKFQHALGRVDGRGRAPHPDPRRHLHLSLDAKCRDKGADRRCTEANPMAMLVEQAGARPAPRRGRISNCADAAAPARAVFLGSKTGSRSRGALRRAAALIVRGSANRKAASASCCAPC